MRLRVPERYRDPGAWQYADYLLGQGLGAHASVRASKVRLLDSRAGGGRAPGVSERADVAAQMQCRIFAAQSWASERVLRYVRSRANRGLPRVLRLSVDDAGMLNAMLFGDRAGLNKTQRVGFERTGSFHLFVVSGMHVGLLAGMVFWLARRLKLRDWLATLLTVGLTFGYALLTGFGAPVQRALFMTVIFLLARLLSRDRNVLNALGAAALGVLVWSPGALVRGELSDDVSGDCGDWRDCSSSGRAELSAVCASGREHLGWVGGYGVDATGGAVSRDAAGVGRCVRRCVWRMGTGNSGGDDAMGTVGAGAGTDWAGGGDGDGAADGGLLPSGDDVCVADEYAERAAGGGAGSDGCGDVLLCAGERMGGGAAGCGDRSAAAWRDGGDWTGERGSCCEPAGSGAGLVGGAAGCGGVGFLLLGGAAVVAGWAWVAVLVLPAVVAMVLWPEPAVVSQGMMEVTAIDVGQGDSILVVGPDGKTMLVDAGGPVGGLTEAAEATSRFDVGEEVVSPYLWSRRFRRLDVLVLSHAHSDHMGGMPAVMRNFRPRELWVSIDPDSEAYRALLAEAKELGVVVRHFYAGDSVAWGGTQVTVLAPAGGLYEWRRAGE